MSELLELTAAQAGERVVTGQLSARELFDSRVSRVCWRLWEVDERARRTGRLQPDWGDPASGDLRATTLEPGPHAHEPPPQSGNAFSRDVVEQACPLPELERVWRTGSAHADAFLVDLAGLLGVARELPEPGGTYRVHAANDWANLGPAAKLERIQRLYVERSERLARHCERLGLSFDRAAWERQSWLMRTVRAKGALESIPAGAALTLVDGNAVDLAVAGDRDRQDWGPPANDREAIRELDRLREQRGGFLAVLWPAFWWFDTYPGFAAHLERTAPCALQTDELRVYSLGS